VDPRAGLDDVEKRKFLTLLGLELQYHRFVTEGFAVNKDWYEECFAA
jgi:hypothetical protein